jgi:DNA-binding protein YbaB
VLTEGFKDIVDDTAQAGKDIYDGFTDAIEDARTKDPVEFVTEEDLDKTKDKVTGFFSDLIPSLDFGIGGAGAGVETPQVGGLLAKLGEGTTAPTVEGTLNIVDIEMDEDVVDEEDIDKVIAAADLVKRQTQAMAQSVAGFVEHTFNQIASGTQTFSEVMTDMLKNLVKQLAIMVAQFIILNTLFGGMGVDGLSLGKFIGKGFGIPQFASGGIVSGPVIAQVGEYAGASHNPEVIAPLDKLQSMMGGQAVQVTGKISGRDILLTSERNSIDRNRVRGF